MKISGSWLIALICALLGIVGGTFISLGAQTDWAFPIVAGYLAIVLSCFLGCMISYRKGHLDGKK